MALIPATRFPMVNIDFMVKTLACIIYSEIVKGWLNNTLSKGMDGRINELDLNINQRQLIYLAMMNDVVCSDNGEIAIIKYIRMMILPQTGIKMKDEISLTNAEENIFIRWCHNSQYW